MAMHTLVQTESYYNRHESYYNRHAHNFQDIQEASTVALQIPHTRLWDTYSTVLVHNKRFLQYHTPVAVRVSLELVIVVVEFCFCSEYYVY